MRLLRYISVAACNISLAEVEYALVETSVEFFRAGGTRFGVMVTDVIEARGSLEPILEVNFWRISVNRLSNPHMAQTALIDV